MAGWTCIDRETNFWDGTIQVRNIITDNLSMTGRLSYNVATAVATYPLTFYEGTSEAGYLSTNYNYDQLVLSSQIQLGRQIVLAATYGYQDFGHPTQTNPTLYIHSATDPAGDNTQYVSICHDASHAIIATGKGHLYVSSASGGLVLPNSSEQATMTNAVILFASGGLLYAKSAAGNVTKITAS